MFLFFEMKEIAQRKFCVIKNGREQFVFLQLANNGEGRFINDI